MTITIELAPELQAQLARQAATHGVELDVYAASLLEGAANGPLHLTNPLHLRPLRGHRRDRAAQASEATVPSLGGMTIRQLRHEARP